MPRGAPGYPIIVHKTEHETAVLAKDTEDSAAVRLIRLAPYSDEVLGMVQLFTGKMQINGIRTYIYVDKDDGSGSIKTVEEFSGEVSLCERIVQDIMQDKPISGSFVTQLLRSIVTTLLEVSAWIGSIPGSNVDLRDVCFSALNLHNVTFVPAPDNGLHASSCVLKGFGLAHPDAKQREAIPALIARLLYCLLMPSFQDTLPVDAMIDHLCAAGTGRDTEWRHMASIAQSCLRNSSLTLDDMRAKLAMDDIEPPPSIPVPESLPSTFALSPATSPRRSPSPLPLSLSELLLENQQHYTPLMLAVISGQLHTAKIVLKDFVRKRDINRNTALMLAVICDSPQMVELLAPHEHGCTNTEGDTALLIAITNGYHNCCLPLLQYELSVPNEHTGVLPKTLVFELRQQTILEEIFNFESTARDAQGCTALMRAVLDKKPIDDLITVQFGNIHAESNGYTALILAIMNDNLDAVQKLWKYEGNIADRSGKYPLEIAILARKKECALAILNSDLGLNVPQNKLEKLVSAVKVNNWRKAEQLYKSVCITKPDDTAPRSSYNAAHARSSTSKPANARLSPRGRQNTGFHIDTAGNTDLMYLLMDKIPDLQLSNLHDIIKSQAGHRNKHGVTALHIAIQKSMLDVIELLIPYELHIPDTYGNLPLKQAILMQNADAVIIILNALQLPPTRSQQMLVTNFLERNDWRGLRRFLEESPDVCNLL